MSEEPTLRCPRCGSANVKLLTFELEEEFSGALVAQLPPKEEWVCPNCGHRWRWK